MPTKGFINTTGRWASARENAAGGDALVKGELTKTSSLEIVRPPLQPTSSQARQPDTTQAAMEAQAITEVTDPRWVLAVRVAEALQGAILPAEKRERLIRVGKMLGLTAFDANLIVAMVQDQARRGNRSTDCAHAAREQLSLIPYPGRAAGHGASPNRSDRMRWTHLVAVAAATIVAELFVLWWLLGWLRQGS